MAKRKSGKKAPAKAKAKVKASAKAAPKKQAAPGSVHLHEVIQNLIDARRRGDAKAGEEAASALETIRKGHAAAHVRQAAAEAKAVAGNPEPLEARRMLTNIAKRVQANA